MAFNVSTLTEYVDEQREPLIGQAVLAAKTAKLLTLQSGVKGKSALNLLTSTTVFGDGNVCGFTSAGESKLTQRVIEVGQIKVNKSYCEKDLLKYWAGYKVRVAAGQETLPFEEQLINDEIRLVAQALEIAIWQGDTDSVTANLNKFDGLIKIIDAASGVISAVSAPAATSGDPDISQDNVIEAVNNVYAAIPAELVDRDDVRIFCGSDVFRTYILALTKANMFHYVSTPDNAQGQEIVIPGTNIRLIAVNGLNGTYRMFAFSLANVFYGTDLENDEETFEFWRSQDNRDFRLVISFNAGVQVAFPDEIVEYTQL